MSLSLFDTARRAVVPFAPLRPGRVAMYHCGPTVYSTAHVGNFRSFLLADLLRRHLEASGFAVRQVMNITDVGHLTDDDRADAAGEDKLLVTARALGWDPLAVARHFEAEFHRDRRLLRIADADHYPRASEHVGAMVQLIGRLLDRGHAYVVDGEAYFSVPSFPAYGALSGRTVEDLRAGARVEVRSCKRHPADFALWKRDAGHLMQFDPHELAPGCAPGLERGFPGWHIECSAMSHAHLGAPLDIHTGGEDNLFPHHECEVAQTTAATGAELSRYWLHARHLLVNGKKLSKRDGTALTLAELDAEGFAPRVVRFALLSHHYRRPMNLTDESLVAARAAVGRLQQVHDALSARAGPGVPSSAADADAGALTLAFRAAVDVDLDVPAALVPLFQAVRRWQARMPDGPDAAAALGALRSVDELLAVLDRPRDAGRLTAAQLRKPAPDPGDALEALDAGAAEPALRSRHVARQSRDWATADRIRAALAEAGIVVEDLPDGGVAWRRTDHT